MTSNSSVIQIRFLSSGTYSIDAYTIQGRRIQSYTCEGKKLDIPVSKLSAGVSIFSCVSLTTGNRWNVKHIVK